MAASCDGTLTMVYAIGDKVRAVSLRNSFPVFGYAGTDVAKNNSVAYYDAPGLTVYMDADAVYALDGYIAYTSGATPGMRVTIAAPTNATGWWSTFPVTAGPTGDVEGIRKTDFAATTEQGLGGSASFSGRMMCWPQGYIRTNNHAGPLRVRFAQLVSDPSATVIEAGSWIRLTRIS